jgi:glycosyltransferase involved in cell wall biosynthesis
MNILILNWRGPNDPLAGGAELVTFQHAKYWVSKGHNVWWFTSSCPGTPTEEIISDVKIIHHGSSTYYGVIFCTFFWYFFKKHPDFDVVVDQFHGLPFFAPIYVEKPVVGFIHELGSQVVQYNPWPKPFNLLPSILAPLFEPWVFKLFYLKIPFFTVSASTKLDLEKLGISKIQVVPNGIFLPNKLVHYPKDTALTFLYLSTVTKDKGIEDALEVFSILRNSYPKAQFWVVGKGDSDYAISLSKRYSFVRFWGYVSQAKKFELLSRSHVLVFPSVHEGWGMVILEAAAMGTPTVAYDVSGVRDAVANNQTGLLASAGNLRQLSDLVIQLINNKQNYVKMCSACILRSHTFTWQESQSKLLKFIESVVYNQ